MTVIGLGTPLHALVLATTAGFSDNYEPVIEEALVNDSVGGSSGCPCQPGLRRQARHAPELGEVVRDQRHIESQGVGGNPEVVGTDRLAD